MRIATSTLFDQQTNAIENLAFTQAQDGHALSTGKILNAPEDDPQRIAQDLAVQTTIANDEQAVKNTNDQTNELTSVDGALNSLTNIMQSARQIAITGASDTINTNQRQSMAQQINGLISEAVGIANTQYNGKYVFAGTVAPQSPPVQANGQPPSSVTFTGNLQQESQVLANGQNVPLSTTIQSAFNFNATDGSPDIFQALINLRNTLQNGTVVDQTATRLNKASTVIAPTTTINSANFVTALTPDSAGNVSFSIAGPSGSQNFTFSIVPGPPPTVAAVVAAINAATPATGVSASFNAKTERLSLTTGTAVPFRIDDVPSAGATNSSNFTAVFGLTNQGDTVGNLSTQIGDLDNALTRLLKSRAVLGGNLQNLAAVNSQVSSDQVNNTKVRAGIEDTDIAKVVGQFSQTQTALQAAYSTTTRLEAKDLWDYIG